MSKSLKEALRERDLTMSELAARLGVDKATVTRWAKGVIPVSRVVAIEAHTGIPRERLRPDLFSPSPAQPERPSA